MINIPYAADISNIERIDKGTSLEEKYLLTTSDGAKQQLRISNIDTYDKTKRIVSLLKQLATEGLPAQKVIAFGIHEDTKKVYLSLEWCEGKNAYEAIPMLTEKEQYSLGLQSGQIIKKIHSLSVPEQNYIGDETPEMLTKRRIEEYLKSGHRFDGDKTAIQFLEKNISLVKHRPRSLRHSDYHFNNILVTDRNTLTIIDWECYSYGDPWEEFQQTAWIVHGSPAFAVGHLHGYFNGRPSDKFFKVLAFYMASCSIWSPVWATGRAPHLVEYFLQCGADTVKWFCDFLADEPSWYTDIISSQTTS